MMRLLVPVLLSAMSNAGAQNRGQNAGDLVISRGSSRDGGTGGGSNFTGAVRVEGLFQPRGESRALGASVAFDAGARTSWHTHPIGQVLIVTAGVGRVQKWGERAEAIRTGDVVWIPAGTKHWHGASPDSAMTHIAIVEQLNGSSVEWMEAVTQSDYEQSRAPSAPINPPTPTSATLRTVPATQQAPATQPGQPSRTTSAQPGGNQQERLAPVMADYTNRVLFGDVYLRPELSPRDRSLVTISTLIATGKPDQLQTHLGRALTSGVKPLEASGVLATLAIYAGWPSAVVALDVYDRVYTSRNIDTAPLRATAALLPVPESDAARKQSINLQYGVLAPKFAQLSNDVVMNDLWRRPDLSVRDRSLVTLSAIAALGDDDQLDVYLQRAVQNGLTRDQITEAFTHLAFYAGWSRATKAINAAGRVLGASAVPPR